MHSRVCNGKRNQVVPIEAVSFNLTLIATILSGNDGYRHGSCGSWSVTACCCRRPSRLGSQRYWQWNNGSWWSQRTTFPGPGASTAWRHPKLSKPRIDLCESLDESPNHLVLGLRLHIDANMDEGLYHSSGWVGRLSVTLSLLASCRSSRCISTDSQPVLAVFATVSKCFMWLLINLSEWDQVLSIVFVIASAQGE